MVLECLFCDVNKCCYIDVMPLAVFSVTDYTEYIDYRDHVCYQSAQQLS